MNKRDIRIFAFSSLVLFALFFINILIFRHHLTLFNTVAALLMALVGMFFVLFLAPLPWMRLKPSENPFHVLLFLVSVPVLLVALCAVSIGVTSLLGCHKPFAAVFFNSFKWFVLVYSIPIALGGFFIGEWRIRKSAKEQAITAECPMREAPDIPGEARREPAIYWTVKDGAVSRIVSIQEISHITRQRKKIIAHSNGETLITTWKSLEAIRGDCPAFIEASRGYLVRLAAVLGYRDDEDGLFLRVPGAEIEVSRRRAPEIRQLLSIRLEPCTERIRPPLLAGMDESAYEGRLA